MKLHFHQKEITQGSLCNRESKLENKERLERGPCQQLGGRGEGSMDGATQSSFLSPGGSYLCKSRGIGDGGSGRHACIFAYRCDGVSRKHSSPGTPKGSVISVPTVLPHVTLQITGLAALNSPRSSIYTEAANRNHPLYEGRLVSGHRPFMVMDVTEG